MKKRGINPETKGFLLTFLFAVVVISAGAFAIDYYGISPVVGAAYKGLSTADFNLNDFSISDINFKPIIADLKKGIGTSSVLTKPAEICIEYDNGVEYEARQGRARKALPNLDFYFFCAKNVRTGAFPDEVIAVTVKPDEGIDIARANMAAGFVFEKNARSCNEYGMAVLPNLGEVLGYVDYYPKRPGATTLRVKMPHIELSYSCRREEAAAEARGVGKRGITKTVVAQGNCNDAVTFVYLLDATPTRYNKEKTCQNGIETRYYCGDAADKAEFKDSGIYPNAALIKEENICPSGKCKDTKECEPIPQQATLTETKQPILPPAPPAAPPVTPPAPQPPAPEFVHVDNVLTCEDGQVGRNELTPYAISYTNQQGLLEKPDECRDGYITRYYCIDTKGNPVASCKNCEIKSKVIRCSKGTCNEAGTACAVCSEAESRCKDDLIKEYCSRGVWVEEICFERCDSNTGKCTCTPDRWVCVQITPTAFSNAKKAQLTADCQYNKIQDCQKNQICARGECITPPAITTTTTTTQTPSVTTSNCATFPDHRPAAGTLAVQCCEREEHRLLFRNSMRISPTNPKGYINLGIFDRCQADLRAVLKYLPDSQSPPYGYSQFCGSISEVNSCSLPNKCHAVVKSSLTEMTDLTTGLKYTYMAYGQCS